MTAIRGEDKRVAARQDEAQMKREAIARASEMGGQTA